MPRDADKDVMPSRVRPQSPVGALGTGKRNRMYWLACGLPQLGREVGGEKRGCLPSSITSGNSPWGGERRSEEEGSLLEDGALPVPVTREEQSVPFPRRVNRGPGRPCPRRGWAEHRGSWRCEWEHLFVPAFLSRHLLKTTHQGASQPSLPPQRKRRFKRWQLRSDSRHGVGFLFLVGVCGWPEVH